MRERRAGRKYPRRKLWIERRDAAFARAGDHCEVSGAKLVGRAHVCTPAGKILHTAECWERAAHHILAERWCRKFCPGCDPHILENLVVVTPGLHAQFTAAENKLFRADWLGYRTELHRLGFPLAMLDRALKAICASVP